MAKGGFGKGWGPTVRGHSEDRTSCLATCRSLAVEDLAYRARTDRRRALRTLKLVDAVLRDPFGGLGKPEPLRGELSRRWSRRIDTEHRLVYQVTDDRVHFLAAPYHY